VRLAGLVVAMLLLGACTGSEHDAASTGAKTETETRTSTDAGVLSRSEGRGKIIDNANLLDAGDRNGLTQELAEINRLGGPEVTVVLVRPTSGESMEQIGWAVAGRPSGKAVVLLANPDSAAVRVEGAIAPDAKARIASAMQQQLRAKQPAEAVRGAIAVLRGAS
jgi:uncharacterized membrane protein YgcG